MDNRLPLVNVTARILDQNGKPVPRARVTMRLTTNERFGGLIVPRETSQMTDANGKAVLRVFPNELGSEGSEYLVTINYVGDGCTPCGKVSGSTATPGGLRHFYVVVPNSDCNLFDITDLPPYEHRGSGQVIPAEVAGYASQAANAADRAQNIVETMGAIRKELEAVASNADSAKQAAQAAALEAEGHERRAKDTVDGINSLVQNFECSVIERTEDTANRLTKAATDCIKQAENTALLAIEARSGEALTELAIKGSDIQQGALAAIATNRENALLDIDHTRREALAELRDEAALFGEDFEALTERAESAAKRAGCSAAAAANSANKACLCAHQAEEHANRAEAAKVVAVESASAAKEAHACAHADAVCAQNAATAAHLDAGKAEAAATESERSAEMADCYAKKSCKCAEVSREAQEAVAEDKEYIEKAVPLVVAALEEKEERLAAIEKRQDEADSTLDALEEYAADYEKRMEEEIDRANNTLSVARGKNRSISIVLAKGIKAGGELELPVFYIVGRSMLRVSWGGMLMYEGIQYNEVGDPEDVSKKLAILIDIPEQSTVNIWIATPHVTGDLKEAEKKAGEIIDNLAETQGKVDAEIAKLDETLQEIANAGDVQVGRVQEEVKRAKAEADRAEEAFEKTGEVLTLTQGANLEASLKVKEGIPAGTVFDIPVNYVTGRAALRVFWGGMLMANKAQYQEVGEPHKTSRQIKTLIDIPKDAELEFWSVATGSANVDDLVADGEKLKDRLDELSGRVDEETRRVDEVGEAQIERAKQEADRAEAACNRTGEVLALTQGANIEGHLKTTEAIPAGSVIDIPVAYITGRAALRVFWGGFSMTRGEQYEEVGDANKISRQIKTLIDLPVGAALSFWSVSTGLPNAGELSEQAARLEEKLNSLDSKADDLSDAVDAELGKVSKDGQAIIDEAKSHADRAEEAFAKTGEVLKLTQGINTDATWIVKDNLKAGDLLPLPLTYIVGRAALRIFWGGFLMNCGVQYEEVGEAESISTQIKLLIDLPADAVLNAWSVSTCATSEELQEKLAQAVDLLARAEKALADANEAKDKALEAVAAIGTGSILTVPSMSDIDGRPDSFFIIDPDMEQANP